jgi:hypothetical protein
MEKSTTFSLLVSVIGMLPQMSKLLSVEDAEPKFRYRGYGEFCFDKRM